MKQVDWEKVADHLAADSKHYGELASACAYGNGVTFASAMYRSVQYTTGSISEAIRKGLRE